MPRKAKTVDGSTGGGDRSGSSRKKTLVKDTLLPNTRKGEAPQVEQTIEDMNALNEKVDQALIGYARFDILANKSKLRFRDWNTQPLGPSQVKMLLNSFLIDVVSQFNYSYGIPLVVDPSTLVEGMYSTKGDGSGSHHEAKKAELHLELKLKDGLPSDFKLAAAGGQHRLYALAEWYDIKRKQPDKWKWEEVSVLSEDADTISKEVINDLNKRIKPNVKTLEGVLACGGQWLIVLYDKRRAYCAQTESSHGFVAIFWVMLTPQLAIGNPQLAHLEHVSICAYKISKQLGLHISRNETKHVYMESPMEGLIQIFRAHCAADKTFKDIMTVAHAKGTPAKQRELLKLDYVWDVMSYFDSAGTHFWHSDIMKFGDFYNTMLSSYGGILAYVVRKSESRLRYCFNTLLLDDTDVDALLMSIESDPNDAASMTVLRGIYNSLKSASPVVSAITSGIRSIVDECFIMFFGDAQASNNFANPTSEEWATAFAQYSNTLPIKFKELVDGLTSRGDLGVDDSDIAVALKTCSLKAWVILACDHMSQDLPSFPFLSSSSFIAMASHLKVIESALLELASWWSPFIYWASIFPCKWSPGSATADMFCAIMAHSSYIPQRRSNVCDQKDHHPSPHHQTDGSACHFGLGPTSAMKSRAPSKLKDDEDDNEWGKHEFIPDNDNDDDGNLDPSKNIGDKQEDPSDGTPDSCEEHTLCREREREEREHHFPSLQKEVQDAVLILTSSTCSKPLPPLDFYSPTTHISCLSSNVLPNSFHGQSLLWWHTWEWASISGPSQICNLRILACTSVAEHCIIMHYPPLPFIVLWTNRHPSFVSSINVRPQQQTTLANDLTVTKRNINLMWPDNITAAPSAGNCAKPFVLSEEMSCFKFKSLLATQSQQLQRVMNVVESQRISWKDTTNTTVLQDRPPITDDVHTCLIALIKALDLNACVQRRAAHPCNPVGDLTDLDKQTIPVIFRNSMNPSGKNASSSLAFTILSREEVEEQESSKMVIDANGK
ncbi:hypothetical protein EDC04DRAFT_2896739 [Pisolithus marmoratus]|nr:hypothetical protein EDC04DRAFT_2896739 [Pisolithus marmoratus]